MESQHGPTSSVLSLSISLMRLANPFRNCNYIATGCFVNIIFVYHSISIKLVSAIFYLKGIGIGLIAKMWYCCITNVHTHIPLDCSLCVTAMINIGNTTKDQRFTKGSRNQSSKY